jgi:glycosyltransferase involved in cell wall biosynthesis
MITYNHEHFVARAIESVLAQRVSFEYEIVIGEDCSTDGTRVVVMNFQRRYPERVKLLLRERNVGGFRNIESTLAACHGEYVTILEGDDYWTAVDKLQRQVDFLDVHPDYAVCCHRARWINETGLTETFPEVVVFPSLAAGPYAIEDLLKDNFVVTCSAVLRRSLTGPLPPCFSKTKIGDWPRYVLAARHGKIQLMDDIMAVYRIHSESMWSSMSRLTRLEECSQMLKTLDKQLGYQYTSTIRKTLSGFYLEMASIARQEGERIRTAKHVISCMRNGGWHLPGSERVLAGLAAYTLIGSWYKVFSRAKSASGG